MKKLGPYLGSGGSVLKANFGDDHLLLIFFGLLDKSRESFSKLAGSNYGRYNHHQFHVPGNHYRKKSSKGLSKKKSK